MIALLLSTGCHPVSGRPRMNPACARAAELALRWRQESGEEIRALHLGDPGNPALRDYLGLGLPGLRVLDPGGAVDALPPLVAELRRIAPRLVLCGAATETGEGSGMLPYLLAEALGMAVLAGVIALAQDAKGQGVAVQASSPTLHRRFALDRPAVLIAAEAAPPARPVAFARARAGRIDVQRVMGAPDAVLDGFESRPARIRPRRIGAASAGGGNGPALTGLSADQAAARIADFLRQNGFIERNGDG